MLRTVQLILIACMVGCAGEKTELSPAPSVVVKLNGQPAQGLSVRVYSSDGSPIGGGMTDPSGRVTLRGSNDQGLAPGTYKVTVIDVGEEETDPMAVKPKSQKLRVPTKYTKPNTTPASLTIEANKMEYEIDIM